MLNNCKKTYANTNIYMQTLFDQGILFDLFHYHCRSLAAGHIFWSKKRPIHNKPYTRIHGTTSMAYTGGFWCCMNGHMMPNVWERLGCANPMMTKKGCHTCPKKLRICSNYLPQTNIPNLTSILNQLGWFKKIP